MDSSAIVKRRVGRPSKATPERLTRFLELVKAGVTRGGAAQAVGVDPTTVCRWMRTPGPEFDRFRVLVRHAEAMFEQRLVRIVNEAALKDGRLALKLLERRCPQGWSPRRPMPTSEFDW